MRPSGAARMRTRRMTPSTAGTRNIAPTMSTSLPSRPPPGARRARQARGVVADVVLPVRVGQRVHGLGDDDEPGGHDHRQGEPDWPSGRGAGNRIDLGRCGVQQRQSWRLLGRTLVANQTGRRSPLRSRRRQHRTRVRARTHVQARREPVRAHAAPSSRRAPLSTGRQAPSARTGGHRPRSASQPGLARPPPAPGVEPSPTPPATAFPSRSASARPHRRRPLPRLDFRHTILISWSARSRSRTMGGRGRRRAGNQAHVV